LEHPIDHILFFEKCKYSVINLLYSSLYFYICLTSFAVQLDRVYPDLPALRQLMPKILGIAHESYSEFINKSLASIAA